MTHLFDKILVASDLSAASDQVITCLPGGRADRREQLLRIGSGNRHRSVRPRFWRWFGNGCWSSGGSAGHAVGLQRLHPDPALVSGRAGRGQPEQAA
jgi:hypothetical protein